MSRISQVSHGEVDLLYVVKIIWTQKKIVLLSVLIAALFALVYCFFFLVPVYQVTSVLRPVPMNELDALNRSGLYSLSSEKALKKVASTLDSYDTRLRFFKENPALFKSFEKNDESSELAFERFNRDSLKVLLSDTKKDALSNSVSAALDYKQGVDGVSILNKFVDYAIETEREAIKADMTVIVRNRMAELAAQLSAARVAYSSGKESLIAGLLEQDGLKQAQLQDELKALRQQLKLNRIARMQQLAEAIGIARSLGIQRPTTPSMLGDAARPANNVFRTEVNNQAVPLYFMGVDALEAERAALAKRANDDFTDGRVAQIAKELQLLQHNRQVQLLQNRQNEDLFLQNVDDVRKEMDRLKNLGIDFDNIKMVQIDRRAIESLQPVRPMRAIIILVAVLVGLLVGVVVAILRHYALQQASLAVGRQVEQTERALERRTKGDALRETL
ncbi:Wzz/FepE/Etk N-terminal domain-containing protein [Pseudomonas donghuensis]|uniref:Wzz/FepE/Etk N-terminal domain-containing protein n=1 Tax=Pseudomonas donghuensis TaxID=1163398 RepID=UPI00029A4243|nr:Wzz/FepE/Etk N-terminal domain-containing protein [Pseudomonas donghuensis]